MKQVIYDKNKPNITHRSGRIGRPQSNSVGLSFIIFGERVPSSEGSDPQSHFNTLIIGDFTPCRWSVEPQILKKQPVRPKRHGFTWNVLHSDILYSPVLDV